jgi:flavin reductase (DIM6/NTAB) family NADH-FMN oxidoreductase RutF
LQIAISCQNWNYTKELIEKTGHFNLSVLTEDLDFETVKRFGMQSGKEVDKFEGFKGLNRSHNGLYHLTEKANAFFSVKVNQKIELSTHTMFIGEVIESQKLSDKPSCTYSHYHKNIKNK